MNSSPDLFLGVDGGQSSTKALIGDADGKILGRGSAGPCNHVGADQARAKFLRTIKECVSAACLDAGVKFGVRYRAACFGMSGGPEDKESLLREIVDAEQWQVTHDGMIALSGALAGQDGVVAIAGTGSLIFARRQSVTMRCGGWGYVFGDEGGAFWILREALRAALRFEEGWGRETRLRAMFLQAAGAKNVNEVLHLFYSSDWPRSKAARLAVEVDRLAEAGDVLANEILRDAGEKLAEFVLAARNSLWSLNDVARASYIGGVFRSSRVLTAFTDALEKGGKVNVHPPVFGADAGALLEAYRLAGIVTTLREL